MRRIAVGLVTLFLLASCTDDPTVSSESSNESVGVSETTQGSSETAQAPSPSPTPEPAAVTDTTAVDTADEADSNEPDTSEPEADTSDADNDGLFPTVVDATASSADGTSWRVDVTLSSEYDSPARYADAWRVLDADDNELGVRVLTHDHANEQPFTRSHTVEIPDSVTTVFIEGRDQLNGWSGERFELTLTAN